jgi:hypothetical protein
MNNRVLPSTVVLGLILTLVAGLSVQLPQGAAHAKDPDREAPVLGFAAPQPPLGTSFTYQGRLTDGGSPADGEYDLFFRLYNAATSGTLLGAVTVPNHQVTTGLFTVQLDFGQVFTGTALFLEIAVRPGASSGAYTTLTPRQELTPAPYALALPGLWTQQNLTSPNLIGGYSGNTVAGGVVGAVIGGGGNETYPSAVRASYATIGGGSDHVIGDLGDHSTIGGGWSNDIGDYSNNATIGGGSANSIGDLADQATIGGGGYNDIGTDSWFATIGGGFDNDIGDDSLGATVGGGESNGIGNDSSSATVAGGENNGIGNNCPSATIGGGAGNDIEGNNWYGTIGGGRSNDIGENSDAATIGGGYRNDIGDGSFYATIGGGQNNLITGTAQWATIPGGRDNKASGDYAFAAGRRAKANHAGTFVFADSNDFDFGSVAANTFRVRATGGVRFVLAIDGTGNTTWSCGVSAGSSSWNCTSDRNLKENLQRVDGREVLRRLQEMPIYTWNGKGQDPAGPHMGPMAQDFHAAFDLGEDDTHISTIDLDGVALAAIQGLHAQNQELAAENAALLTENATQQEQIDDLEARLTALEQGAVPPSSAFGLPTWLLLGGLVLAGGVALQRHRAGGQR